MVVDTTREAVVPPPALLSRVSWGAIFAGAIIAVALTALLTLLGLGIGLGELDPRQRASAEGIGKGTLAWWAVTSIVATGFGGFVAGRLAGIPRSFTGSLHGLTVWAVATLLTLWLATTAVGTILGAATNVVTTTARATAGAVGTVGGAAIDVGGAAMPTNQELESAMRQQGVTRENIIREAEEIARRAGIDQTNVQAAEQAVGQAAQNIVMRPGTAGEELNRLIDRLFEGPDAALSPAERERLIDEISRRTGVTRQEAEQIANRWQTQAVAATERVNTTAQQVRTQAGEVSHDVLNVLSGAAWGMFLISLAGLVAAVLGGALAAPGFGLIAATAAARRDYDYDHPADRDRAPPRPEPRDG